MRPVAAPGAGADRVPVLVIPCVEGRPEGQPPAELAALYGSVVQASWSFQLAARLQGLGASSPPTTSTTNGTWPELLGIPFQRVTQVALIPVAHTIGDEFKPARRKPLDQVLHTDGW